jgi:hypothetical protein
VRVSVGAGFGPDGVGAEDAAPFSVAGPANLTLDGARTGKATFTVSNKTGRSVRTRVFVQPGAGAEAAWFQLVGDIERAMPPDGSATVDVSVSVPPEAAAGSSSFTLGTALEETPDQVVSSPAVAFEIPAPGRRKFPWWIVIVAVVALVVLAGGGILIWSLTRGGESEPTSSPTPTPSSDVFLSDDFLVDTSSKSVDLDGDGMPDIQVDDADLSSAIPADRPTTVFGLEQGVAIVDKATKDACRGVVLESSTQIAQGDDGVLVCVFTSGEHLGVLEFGATQPDETRKVLVTLWN